MLERTAVLTGILGCLLFVGCKSDGLDKGQVCGAHLEKGNCKDGLFCVVTTFNEDKNESTCVTLEEGKQFCSAEKHYSCKADGECTPGEWGCIVGSDADCEQSEVCKAQGKCLKKGDGADAECASSR